jgi:hypothetical protein
MRKTMDATSTPTRTSSFGLKDTVGTSFGVPQILNSGAAAGKLEEGRWGAGRVREIYYR